MRYITLAIFLVSLSGFSQTISKQVIGPAGVTYENDTNKLSYTAGEVLVGAMTSEDGINLISNSILSFGFKLSKCTCICSNS